MSVSDLDLLEFVGEPFDMGPVAVTGGPVTPSAPTEPVPATPVGTSPARPGSPGLSAGADHARSADAARAPSTGAEAARTGEPSRGLAAGAESAGTAEAVRRPSVGAQATRAGEPSPGHTLGADRARIAEAVHAPFGGATGARAAERSAGVARARRDAEPAQGNSIGEMPARRTEPEPVSAFGTSPGRTAGIAQVRVAGTEAAAVGESAPPRSSSEALARLREGLVEAHTAALRAQEGFLRWATPAGTAPAVRGESSRHRDELSVHGGEAASTRSLTYRGGSPIALPSGQHGESAQVRHVARSAESTRAELVSRQVESVDALTESEADATAGAFVAHRAESNRAVDARRIESGGAAAGARRAESGGAAMDARGTETNGAATDTRRAESGDAARDARGTETNGSATDTRRAESGDAARDARGTETNGSATNARPAETSGAATPAGRAETTGAQPDTTPVDRRPGPTERDGASRTHWRIEVLAPGSPIDDTPRSAPSAVREFKPLARSHRTALFAPDLARLAAGEIHAVFGRDEDRSYDQRGASPDLRLGTAVDGGLVAVTDIDHAGGHTGRGRLTGRCAIGAASADNAPAGFVDGCAQAAQVLALRFGLHLCFAPATLEPGGEIRIALREEAGPGEYDLIVDVLDIDLLPRPHLRASARLIRRGRILAELTGLTVTLRERADTVLGPGEGGVFGGRTARHTTRGEPVLLNEFHMAHASRGDLGVIMGPEFRQFHDRRATRMPDGGLRLCDRILSLTGSRGRLHTGSSVSEYDSPADSWYYREYASATMPNAVLMETSLQSALMMGYFLGPTLTDQAQDYCLRNLDGRATVLRDVDLRGKTIRQQSELLETTVLSDAILQGFRYELGVDGEPFYRGTSLFGYFTAAAMANQTGLDGGRSVPTWLDKHPASAVRIVDITARPRGRGGPGPSRGHLCLLSSIEVVDGGGEFGRGYLRSVRPIDASDWYFGLHFHLDPVMPGSLGVEAVIQAMQEWAIDADLFADLTDPEFVLPAGLEFTWAYRGQILATDGAMTVEAHIKRVERTPGRVRIVADASVFRPGLRIYGMTDLAVEARQRPARAFSPSRPSSHP